MRTAQAILDDFLARGRGLAAVALFATADADYHPNRAGELKALVQAKTTQVAPEEGSAPYCRVCGRPLMTPRSRALGIGPECRRGRSKHSKRRACARQATLF